MIVELLYEILFKAKAAYQIPDEMLDLGGYVPTRFRPRQGYNSPDPEFLEKPLVLSPNDELELEHAED
jgi:hypothetical protein